MKKLFSFLLLFGIAPAYSQTPNDDRSWNPALFLNEEFHYDPHVPYEPGYVSSDRSNVPRHSPLFTPGTYPSVYWPSLYSPILTHGSWDGCKDQWNTPNQWTNGLANGCLTPTVENGNDIGQFDIVPAPVNSSCPPELSHSYYNCGIDSYDLDYPYGYYEIKWDLPSLDRRWVSWWLTSSTQEIDIVELGYGLLGESNDILRTNIHFLTGVGDSGSLPALASYVGTDMTAAYNTVGMEWTPKCIVLYFNGNPINEILYDSRVPHVLMKMLMTPGVHVSGGVPSLPSGDTKTKIDFIKIHTLLKGDLSTTAPVTSITNLNTYVPLLQREIEVNGMSSSVRWNSGKQTLRATESITIKGDVEINGGELILFPHDNPVNY